MKIAEQDDRREQTSPKRDSHDEFSRLLQKSGSAGSAVINGATIGVLLAIKDGGITGLVSHPSQCGSAALCARTIVELRAAHVGRPILLVFENGDPSRPVIVGAVQNDETIEPESRPGFVEVNADGESLVVAAKERLVLRCGGASITLTKDGEVLLRGTLVTTHASDVNRIKGGSVQIN